MKKLRSFISKPFGAAFAGAFLAIALLATGAGIYDAFLPAQALFVSPSLSAIGTPGYMQESNGVFTVVNNTNNCFVVAGSVMAITNGAGTGVGASNGVWGTYVGGTFTPAATTNWTSTNSSVRILNITNGLIMSVQ